VFNPLLDTVVRERTWYDIAEWLQNHIEYGVRRGKPAFKWLNVLDLIDSEAAAYWRGAAWEVYPRA